jgi:Autotransporter beta-domain
MKLRPLLPLVLLSAMMTTGYAQNLIQNGGFEVQNPPVPTSPPSFRIFDVGGLPNWSTTASDQKVEIWSSGYQGVTTISQPDGFYPNGGSYFAELNANMVSTLNQSVTLNKNGALSYSFWHRGRNGTDTMALQIQTLVNGVWTQIFYQQFSTPRVWSHYEGRDVVFGKAGQQFRFNYVSVTGSTTSIGNFIDNAAFGLLEFTDQVSYVPSPELQQVANEGLATQAGVSDQTVQQVKQLGPELYNRFALVRATRQSLFRDPVDQPPPPPSDGKEVRDPKTVTSPGKSFTATLNGNRTTVEAPEHLPWDLWGQGNGVLATAPSIGQIPGQNNAGGAFLIGIDYYLTRNLTIGLYSGYLLNRQNFTGTGGGSAWSDGVAYGLYLSYARPQGGWYGDLSAGGGNFQSQVTRPINLYGENYGSASSRPTGNSFMIYADTGYDLIHGNWSLGPVATFQYTAYNAPAVGETDPYSLNLKVNNQQLTSLFSGLGAHVNYRIAVSKSVILLPELRCFWNHEFYNQSRQVTGSFQSLPGSSYSYTDTL